MLFYIICILIVQSMTLTDFLTTNKELFLIEKLKYMHTIKCALDRSASDAPPVQGTQSQGHLS